MTLSKFAPLLDGHNKINEIHSIDIKAGYSSLRKIGLITLEKRGKEINGLGYITCCIGLS